MTISKIPVLNEADAWDLLEKALTEKLPKTTIQLDFSDWYNNRIKFEGERFDSTITPSLMEAFIELQKTVHRTYSKLTYGTPNKRLKEAEKKSLEIYVKVEPGSSDLTAVLDKAVETLTKGAINQMKAEHYVIIVVATILCVTASVMWTRYLKHRSEVKQADLDLALSSEESHRLEIFARALGREPYLVEVNADADEFRNMLIKNARHADKMHVASQAISSEQAAMLAKATRTPSQEVRLDGEYRITKVDSKDPDFFKVYLVGNGYKEFYATLDTQTIISGINLKLIQDAEWGKKLIRLTINGTTVRGDVTSAKIIDVPERYSEGA